MSYIDWDIAFQLRDLQLMVFLEGFGNSMDCRFRLDCQLFVQIFISIVQIWIDRIGIPSTQLLEGQDWLPPRNFGSPPV